MASFKLKAMSPWKKVKLNNTLDSNPELEGFGGLEVLEDYDILSHNIQPKAKLCRRCAAPDSAQQSKDRKKSKIKVASPLIAENGGAGEEKKAKKRVGAGKLANRKRKRVSSQTENGITTNDSITDADNNSASDDITRETITEMEGWKGLFVPPAVLKSLKQLGFLSPTLIQALTLPAAIRDRQDILGAAETGSGKTLAFGIPVIDKILKMKNENMEDNNEQGVYALVLTPTRELCVQVRDHISKAAQHANISVVSIFGGMSSQKQVRLLKSRPEIIVATPGRLWDIMNSEADPNDYLATVVQTPILVIDEADKMVEKGHFEELTKILTLMKGDEESSRRRQCFVFSATLTYVHTAPDRLVIRKKKRKRGKPYQISKESKLDELIETVGILKRPKIIDITEKSQTASKLVESSIFCTQAEKDLHLYYFLQRHPGRTLIFTNSIDCIRRLLSVFTLLKQALLPLHASMHQKQRLKNLERFTASEMGLLIATDVAARGLDIPNIQHVIHYQVPRTSESYVHRSGRTARALKDGLSVMFVDEKDIQNYKRILKSLGKDDTLTTFPVEQSDLRMLKPIVSLAQRIDSTQHRTEKVKRRDDWFVKMAKEADLELSDEDGPDMIHEEQLRQTVKERKTLEGMKSQLAQMLADGGSNARTYRGKYPTVSGKLELPKTVATKKDTQAIKLVSRKRR